MAEGVTPDPSRGGSELEPTGRRELQERHSKELTKYTPRETHGHETKFRMTYAILGGVALAAVAAAVIFIAAGRPPKPPAWSSWKPTASGDQALGQIAEHVGPGYRLPTGQQLVAVDGGPLQIAGIPVKVVLRPTRNGSPALSDGKGALYTLCGLGKNCAIQSGHKSMERTLLMMREAYELALYTFRYVGDVKQVVVMLPPPPGKLPSQAVFFKRDGLKPALQRPLRFTLHGRAPSIPSLKSGPERTFINNTVGNDVWYFDVIQGQDASVFLELAHFPLQTGAPSSSSSSGSG
jgi:hypothetical protein